ncbi:MAG: DUF2202 domain-containing protein [Caldilineaceae bacterium]|nr:DUF2202 domain-containing protein [Caldilineaceae bacterium]
MLKTKLAAGALALSTLLIGAVPAYAAPAAQTTGTPGTPAAALAVPGTLSEEESAALLFMREEEKLAHDVYVTLGDLWGLPVFDNIASSETKHTEEIRDLLAAEDPHAAMPLSTVYRTLATLKEARLVAEVDAGGRAAYEWVATRPHHHLICQRCGADVGLEPALLTSLSDEIRSATGFEAHLDQHAIYGACARCSATGSTMDGGEA